MDGVATITATATAGPDAAWRSTRSGSTSSAVTVDGAAATTRQRGRAGPDRHAGRAAARRVDDFTIVVTYGASPQTLSGVDFLDPGWVSDGEEVYAAVRAARRRHPVPVERPPDRQGDLHVPRHGAAGPRRRRQRPAQREHARATGVTTWVYDAPDEMATYLVQVVIADLDFVESDRARTGCPVRHAFDADVAAASPRARWR